MQEMDILEMNILDEAENDNLSPEVDKEEDTDYFYCNDDEMLNDGSVAEHEVEDPEVRNKKCNSFSTICAQLVDWKMLIYLVLDDLCRWMT